MSRLGEVAEGLRYEETRLRLQRRHHSTPGTAVNVVPTSARVTGTLRTFTEAQTERRSSVCRTLCDQVAETTA